MCVLVFCGLQRTCQKFIYDEKKGKIRWMKTQEERNKAEERQKERDLESLEEYEKRQNGAEE